MCLSAGASDPYLATRERLRDRAAREQGDQMEQQTDTGEAVAPAVQAPTATPVVASQGMEQTYGGAPVASAVQRFIANWLDHLLMIVTLGLGYLIWMMITWGKGQSPGKKLMGLRVVDIETGKSATWGKMFVRGWIMKPIVACLFGIGTLLSWIGILGSSHRALWDKWSGTVVVVDKEGATLAA
jgi:uncharacterized RDD family membrane protein YckC